MLTHPHKLMLRAKTVMAQFAHKSQEDSTNLFCSHKICFASELESPLFLQLRINTDYLKTNQPPNFSYLI